MPHSKNSETIKIKLHRIKGVARVMMCLTGLAGLALALAPADPSADKRITLNFNPDWKFTKSDPPGAAAPGFGDHDWTNVSTPHTYNDIDTFDDWSLPGHRGEQNQWGGRTWYRKTLAVPESYRGKKVYIEFEAVRQFAEVYLNGQLLGISRNGFAPFGFDLTPHLRFGSPNVLAVMCDNRFMKDPMDPAETAAPAKPQNPTGAKKAGQDLNIAPPASPTLAALSAKVNAAIPEQVDKIQPDQIPWNNPHWHPAHGGIFRNVRLYIVEPLHISLPLYSFLQTAGPYVYATEISDKSAMVNLEVPIENGRKEGAKVALSADVLDRDGKPVLTLKQEGQVAAGVSTGFKLSGILGNPQLWEPDYPYLYRVVCTLRTGSETVDTCEVPLGIRSVRWDANTGFHINGHPLKLHGWGQKPTDEWPGLGAAQPDWLHFYTLELMKQAGGNFVRWGHCLGGPAQIEAGDRLGIITEQPGVDGESDTRRAAWKIRTATFRDTVIYFRNHPSILIWEGGNQKVTRDHAKELRGIMDQYDPHGGRAYTHRRADEITGEFMDIVLGTEGGREIKRLPVVEGEYDREESPRRVWDDFSPPNFGYPEAKGQTYDLTSEEYAVDQVAQYVQKVGAPDHSGGANWIFSDSTSGGRVAVEVARAGGEVDGVRLPKEAYYVCQAMFRADPRVHIIGHWSYPTGTKKTVYVASNGQDVELFLNGRSLGHGAVSDRYLFRFPDIAWEPGEIKAVAYAGGKPVATKSKHTVGAPVSLRLTPIAGPVGLQADGSDIALIDVEAVDAKGERCPTFQQRVDFAIKGPGTWRGGYNSGKIHSINNLFLDLEAGINRVSVRATRTPGAITVTATCNGLKPGSVTIQSVPVKVENGYSAALPAMPAVAISKDRAAKSEIQLLPSRTQSQKLAAPGRFIMEFSYSGPTAGARVEPDAQDGKKIYPDSAFVFARLPGELRGADYIQTANGDRLYSAVDLMEIAVKGGTAVSVAHDDRLARPGWLTRQFKETNLSLTIDGHSMKVFQRRVDQDGSLTLGSNTDTTVAKACNMYIVFVNAVRRSPQVLRGQIQYRQRRSPGPADREFGAR